MLSRYLLGTFAFLALIFLYLAWSENSSWAYYLIPPVIMLAVIYVLGPQIDWWQYKRRPPVVPPPFLRLLQAKSAFLSRLSPQGVKRLLDRMMLYGKAHDFQGKVIKTIPDDVKMVLGYYVSLVTYAKEDFLLKPFERIVFYPHPFPSPAIQELHISEHHTEDGVMIYSLPHVMKAFMSPGAYFQPVLYELGQICQALWVSEDWPVLFEGWEEAMETISDFPKDRVASVVGVEVDFTGLVVHHFFQFPESFAGHRPEEFKKLSDCFGFDPRSPVLNSI